MSGMNQSSKVSLSKLFRKEMKRNIGLPCITSIVFLFSLVMPFINELADYKNRLGTSLFQDRDNHMVEKLITFSGSFGDWTYVNIGIVMNILPTVVGILLMADFHKRAHRDLYFSLPVKRRTWFLITYIEGILFVAVPYFAMLIVLLLGLSFGGMGSLSLWGMGMQSYVVCTLYYISIYSLVTVVTNISGNKIYSVTGVIAIYLFGPLWSIVASLASNLQTIHVTVIQRVLINTCPAFFYLEMVKNAMDKEGSHMAPLPIEGWRIAVMILVTGLAIVCACVAFVRRGDEERTLPIVFPKVRWLAKVHMLLFFVFAHMYIALNYMQEKHSAGVTIILWIVGIGIFVSILAGYLADWFFYLDKEHYRKTIKHQFLEIASCFALFALSYYGLGFAEDGTAVFFPVHYSLDQAKEEECPILEDEFFISNKEKWDSFLENAVDGHDSKLRIAYTNWEMGDNAAQYLELIYKGGKYQAVYSDRSMKKTRKFQYLIDCKDSTLDSDDICRHYVILTDMDDFTMDQFQQKRDQIELVMDYTVPKD